MILICLMISIKHWYFYKLYFKLYLILYFKLYLVLYFKLYLVLYFKFYLILYFKLYLILYFKLYLILYFKLYLILYFKLYLARKKQWIVFFVIKISMATFCDLFFEFDDWLPGYTVSIALGREQWFYIYK